MISVKSNLKQLSKQLAGFGDQIPYATSRALNATAFKARKEAIKRLHKDIDKPTPFTVSGIRYSNSNKRNLTASVYIMPNRWEYLHFQVSGGTRKARNTVIAVASGVKRNKYGNPSRGALKRLLTRKDTFSGNVRGTSGVWQRTKTGLKLLYSYQASVNYQSGRFKWKESIENTVKSEFNGEFTKSIKQAIKTARL